MTASEPSNAELASIVRDLSRSMESLHGDAGQLRNEMADYREAFEAVDRRRTWAWIAGLLAFLVLMGGLTTSLVVNRGNAEVIERIRDCTEAGGACYEANALRGKQNVQILVQTICQSTPPEQRKPPCPAN
jgi:hypothetical protein